mmetsp:Transcript_21426/g.52014  ORF Transcript_21426/g.52014 Transcript_21426/m.52014 type:complete len:276 (+) Transcript_21426:79-906(+)
MASGFRPIGTTNYDTQIYKSSYTSMTDQDKQSKSVFPPGYAGHQHETREQFGYGNPGTTNAKVHNHADWGFGTPLRPGSAQQLPDGNLWATGQWNQEHPPYGASGPVQLSGANGMQQEGRRTTPPLNDRQSPTLRNTGRNFLKASGDPAYFQQREAALQFPSYTPQSGKHGTVGPGGQYLPHPPHIGPYPEEAMTSTYHRGFGKQRGNEGPFNRARSMDKQQPLVPPRHDASGFSVNQSPLAGVSWAPPRGIQGKYDTTYTEMHSSGYIYPEKVA